jgi:hypothetical protein
MRLTRHILFALALAFGLGPLAMSVQAGDIYTVRNVPVDVTAGSALEARNIAQVNGQRAALGQLLRRLTLPEDWAQLPQPDDITVQRSVRGFQVASEKASTTRYIAKLNVSFHPDGIRRMLRARGIAYAETQAKPVVLLAVYDSPSQGRLLWEDANSWRKAFTTLDLTNSLAPITLPLGDAQDIDVSAGQALSGDGVALSSLARRYGAEDIVVAHGVLSGGTMTVTISRIGADAKVEKLTASGGGADAKSAAEAAAADVIAKLDSEWKKAVIVRGGAAGQMIVSAAFSSLGDWETIRSRLASSPLVQDMQVRGIGANGADIRVSYRGSPDKLALVLAQQNVLLTQTGGSWWLRLPEAGAPIPNPLAPQSSPPAQPVP